MHTPADRVDTAKNGNTELLCKLAQMPLDGRAYPTKAIKPHQGQRRGLPPVVLAACYPVGAVSPVPVRWAGTADTYHYVVIDVRQPNKGEFYLSASGPPVTRADSDDRVLRQGWLRANIAGVRVIVAPAEGLAVQLWLGAAEAKAKNAPEPATQEEPPEWVLPKTTVKSTWDPAPPKEETLADILWRERLEAETQQAQVKPDPKPWALIQGKADDAATLPRHITMPLAEFEGIMQELDSIRRMQLKVSIPCPDVQQDRQLALELHEITHKLCVRLALLKGKPV